MTKAPGTVYSLGKTSEAPQNSRPDAVLTPRSLAWRSERSAAQRPALHPGPTQASTTGLPRSVAVWRSMFTAEPAKPHGAFIMVMIKNQKRPVFPPFLF